MCITPDVHSYRYAQFQCKTNEKYEVFRTLLKFMNENNHIWRQKSLRFFKLNKKSPGKEEDKEVNKL